MTSDEPAANKQTNLSARRQRMIFVAVAVLAIAIASFLAIKALQNYTSYFYTSTQIVSGEAPQNKTIRIGGMVKQDSLIREPGALELAFVVTDMSNDVTVRYTGILPDLFKENGGTVARGKLNEKVNLLPKKLWQSTTKVTYHQKSLR